MGKSESSQKFVEYTRSKNLRINVAHAQYECVGGKIEFFYPEDGKTITKRTGQEGIFIRNPNSNCLERVIDVSEEPSLIMQIVYSLFQGGMPAKTITVRGFDNEGHEYHRTVNDSDITSFFLEKNE